MNATASPSPSSAEAWTKHRRARGASLVEHSARLAGGQGRDGLTVLRVCG